MKTNNKTRSMAVIQIINALIWAIVILISSYALKGTDNYELVFFTLIIGSSVQISLLGYISDKFFVKKSCKSQIL